ncbi:MAG: penicillin-binding protein 2 [Betaproteobacteria bacterium]|jgi:cell division protein FtsI (penicillin-binding protein 3)|nr:penicillin-binding protein 2 [Betaproteobacteria bacterium]NBP44928.1 penicillin-binding protein 2 [Betaproteobacteria bacterium]
MSGKGVGLSSSPLLNTDIPTWRSKFIVAVIALGFLGLAVRALHVQVLHNAFYQKKGEVRFVRQLELPASRGRILDRNGVVLASSVPVPSVWASPESIDRSPEQLKQLASLLGLSMAELEDKLKDEDKGFVWLKRQVSEPVAKAISDLKIRGVFMRTEYKRMYAEGEAAAHVVGFTNVENIGQEGIELAFNADLGGKSGLRRVIKNRLGEVVEDLGGMVPPVDGRDVQLTIDSKVQYFAYQRLLEAVRQHQAEAGSVVVADAKTGEVLALANYPSYNPEDRRLLTGANLRNRALTDTFEPGSTMKPFVVGLALDKGIIRPDTMIDTAPGKINMAGFTISDTHPHGSLNVEQVIEKSSNVGTVKISLRMPPKDVWELFSQVGIGQRPQVPFPGAVAGRLKPYATWRPIEQATMSYGYGLSTSLFQLVQAYTLFAHDGVVMPLSLMSQKEPPSGTRAMKPEVAQRMRGMLAMATSERGTAPKAQTIGYSVGGKTGTARKLEGKTYSTSKYRGVFVGLAPIEEPRLVVGVMIDNPRGVYFGGDTAAPVFSHVVQQTLRLMGVAPDKAIQPMLITQKSTGAVE